MVLPSGKFDFIELVGVTSAELEHAKAVGTPALWGRLQDAGLGAVTDVARASILAG